jgi:hypothetical protein
MRQGKKKHKTMDSTHKVEESKRNMLSSETYENRKYDLCVIVHLSQKSHFHDKINLSQCFTTFFFGRGTSKVIFNTSRNS